MTNFEDVKLQNELKMLLDKVIAIYCFMDNLMKEIQPTEYHGRSFTDSQVATVAVVSALYFRGNQSLALDYMKCHVFKHVIGKSGFTKRLHGMKELLLQIIFEVGRAFKYMCCEMDYIIDSFPVRACHNIRIGRCKLLKG